MFSTHFRSYALIISLFLLVAGVSAQDASNQGENQQQRSPDRFNFLRELGLSSDQIREIRLLNAGIRERREAAQERLRNAIRSLDQAIYADEVDESLIETRMVEMQTAQAEIARINFENELAVRKILTPEQLTKFRELRRRANQMRDEIIRRRQDGPPNRSMRRPMNQPASNVSPTNTRPEIRNQTPQRSRP